MEVAVKFPAVQKRCVDNVLAAFHVKENDNQAQLVYLLQYLYPLEKHQLKLFDPEPKVQGALLIQHMLNFSPENCRIICESITSIPKDELARWITHPVASRGLEALLDSKTASKKSKRLMITNCLGTFSKLASDKYASHFLDKCWKVCNLETKDQIATELLAPGLKDNFHAKFVLRNCKIELYKFDKAEWLRIMKKETKKPIKQLDEMDALFATKSK